MRKAVVLTVSAVAVAIALTACGGRKHDVAYYEQLVDSIRKAEQIEDMRRKAGLEQHSRQKEAWFDSLRLRTLPVRNAGDDLARLGDFAEVPAVLNENLGHPATATLKAVQLPESHRHKVLMVVEMRDSVTSSIHLCTMDARYLLVDQLCIYEQKEERRPDDVGVTYMEYYITSRYEITLMLYYQSNQEGKNAELLNLRRFVIDKEGRFQETVVESE